MKKIMIQAELDPEKCVGCGTCVHVCPVYAIRPNPHRPISRTKMPPCSQECPAGNDIEGFIRLIQEGKEEEALLLLHQTNPFPAITGRVCFHPCEEACNRREFDASLSIPTLERYVSDFQPKLPPTAPPSNRPERIAVVGSGPAGLTCAYFLLKKGFSVSLFESKPLLGGWLRYGIPEYRLPRTILGKEIAKLLDLGLNVRTGVTIGKNFSFEQLKTFDAIFIASGRHVDTRLGIPGEELEGVLSGGEFLKKFHEKECPPLGRQVAIIGGGNSAVDTARVALRLGSKPILIYRRSRDEMPAFKKEVEEMEAEGGAILFLASPLRFTKSHGKIRLECLRMELVGKETDGRKTAVPIPNSNFSLDMDSVIVAIGDTPDFSYLFSDVLTENQKIKVDFFFRTNKDKIFAGGDITSDMGTVPSAIQSGRMASDAIENFLNSKQNVKSPGLEIVKWSQMNPDYFESREPQTPGRLSFQESIKGFGEIHLGYGVDQARVEAKRCLGCASLPLFQTEDCRGCGNCEQRCPTTAIRMKPLETPFVVRVEVLPADAKTIGELCRSAHLHPKSIVCFCTSTRAEEIAAAILQGAKTPEEISLKTGARTGCSVLCIQPIFRLLEAAKVKALEPRVSDVWYKTIPNIWDLPAEIKKGYDKIGFRFEEDIEFYKKLTRK
jgi:NADPH-dependent glutamate synthase beta subunit-like oxidoreductase/bacterioferritin-associated ferredoxin